MTKKDAAVGEAARITGEAGLEKQRAQYRAALETLADERRARLILIAHAQQSTLREVKNCKAYMTVMFNYAALTHQECANDHRTESSKGGAACSIALLKFLKEISP